MNTFKETKYVPIYDLTKVLGIMVPVKTNKDTIIYYAVTFYNYKKQQEHGYQIFSFRETNPNKDI